MNDRDLHSIRVHSEAILAIINNQVPEPKSTPFVPSAPKPPAEFISGVLIHDRYKMGAKSIAALDGVKSEMVMTATLALRICLIDFTVYEGVRSLERQKQMVAKGASRTMKSKHLPQADGLSHALDLVPWIGGKPVWDWDGCYKIAHAMDAAATHLGHADNIRWGGAWDRVLSDFGGDLELYEAEVQKYKTRHAGSDFIDGPHFEWVG